MYNSFGETLANEWTPKTVCESRADWLKFEDLSNRDQLVAKRFMFDIYTWSMRIEIAEACLVVVAVLSLDFNKRKNLFCYISLPVHSR